MCIKIKHVEKKNKDIPALCWEEGGNVAALTCQPLRVQVCCRPVEPSEEQTAAHFQQFQVAFIPFILFYFMTESALLVGVYFINVYY